MNFLIILCLIFYLILAQIRLDWAVMLLLAVLPSYLIRFEILGLPMTLLEAMILISFAVWFIFHTEFKNFIRGKYSWRQFRENRKKRIKYPFGLEIILLLIISFMAAAVAGFSDSSLGIWKAYFFEPVLLFILILNLFVSSGNGNSGVKDNQTTPNPSLSRRGAGLSRSGINCGLNKILWSLAISALVVSVLAIYQKFTGAWIFNEFWASAATRRVTSFFGYPNAVGLYLGPIAMVLIGWLIHQIIVLKQQVINYKLLVIFFTIILSLLSIDFAKSEGALIGVAAGIVLFGLLVCGKKVRWAMIFLILIGVISLSAYQPLRAFCLDKTLYSQSLQIRQQQWEETWTMLKGGRLISGAGLANYQKIVAPYHQEGIFLRDYNDPDWHKKTVFNAEYRAKVWQPTEIYLYPHNIFLNFWSELGLAGLLLFIWIIGKFLVIGIWDLFGNWELEIGNLEKKKNKFLVLGLLCAMIVIIIHGLVDVPYFKNDLAVMFWVLVAAISLADTNIRMDANDTHRYE